MDYKRLIEVSRKIMGSVTVDKLAAKYGIDHSDIVRQLSINAGFPVGEAQVFVAGILIGAECAKNGEFDAGT